MKSEPPPSPEFANFDRLVGDMLSVPKEQIQRIKADERKPCECGCGGFPKSASSRFLPGHDLRKAYADRQK
ncbi:MAG TPA: hypothetical protein VGN01_03350 [Acidobacteriaceae bacterium]|jgi:hypothetical protein